MFRFRPVLTPVGGALLVIALFGLIRALFNRNSYEIILASAALLFLLAFGIIGMWKSKKLKSLEPGWKPPFPLTAFSKLAQTGFDNAGDETHISGFPESIPLFFRMHFFVKGRFLPSGSTAGTKKGSSVFVETSVPRGETSSQLMLNFPMSGIFKGDGSCHLRDIFGFFSFPCGQPQQRTLNVRSAPCIGKKTPINAQTGAEDQRNKPSADIERYYMREYTPGDRFRDINWKSSEKIDMLITRISTDNQEKVSRLEIHFRNYGPANASLEALWLLDRAKARLIFFLRSLMEQNASFIFDVCSAGGSWEIENQDDLDNFFEELACISFLPPQNEIEASKGAGDIYVFSTACDIGLRSFLLANNLRPVNLFLIQPLQKTAQKSKKQKAETAPDTEILNITDFESNGCTSSARWFRKDVKRLNVQTNKVEMFYAGLKI